jgi:hypothetical protein
MKEYKISEVMKSLEDIKDNYGDIRVMIHSTHGEKDFIDDIHIGEEKCEFVAEIWS